MCAGARCEQAGIPVGSLRGWRGVRQAAELASVRMSVCSVCTQDTSVGGCVLGKAGAGHSIGCGRGARLIVDALVLSLYQGRELGSVMIVNEHQCN